MHFLGILAALVALYVGQYVGIRFGWGYHVALLLTIIGCFGSFVRIVLNQGQRYRYDPPAPDRALSPELAALVAQSRALERDTDILWRKMRVDGFVFPALLFLPTIIHLIASGQEAYRQGRRGVLGAGLLLAGAYVAIRYAWPALKKSLTRH